MKLYSNIFLLILPMLYWPTTSGQSWLWGTPEQQPVQQPMQQPLYQPWQEPLQQNWQQPLQEPFQQSLQPQQLIQQVWQQFLHQPQPSQPPIDLLTLLLSLMNPTIYIDNPPSSILQVANLAQNVVYDVVCSVKFCEANAVILGPAPAAYRKVKEYLGIDEAAAGVAYVPQQMK